MKSFIALLVISSFTYLAVSQGCATGAASCQTAPATLLSSWTAIVSQVSSIVTGCNSGFVLANNTGTCTTACGAGCMWCLNSTVCLPNGCMSMGYAPTPNAGVCILCNSTSATTNAATCTQSAGTISVVTCVSGYGLYSGSCASCTVNATTVTLGIANCVACSGITVSSGNWVTCTACATGYVLIPITTTYVIVPQCQAINSTLAIATNAIIAANSWGFTASSTWQYCNALNLGAAASGTFGAAATCTSPMSGYWCYNTSTQTCITAAAAVSAGMTAIANSNGGIINVAASVLTGYATLCLTGFQAFGGACYNASAVVTNCVMLSSATACSQAAPGYNLASSGTVSACSASGCSSLSCATGSYLLANGTCATGTPMTNCLLHNSTSVCLVCMSGYVQPQPTCVGCTANCVACNVSSGSNTTCATCGPNFVISSGACTAAPANSTNNSKALFSGLAFISMVLYYVL